METSLGQAPNDTRMNSLGKDVSFELAIHNESKANYTINPEHSRSV